MGNRFASYSPDTDWLFPPRLSDLLEPDDFALFVNKAVDELDMSGFSAGYSAEGGVAYPPAMYLKLMFYGYATGVHSSRKLERLACREIGAMYLCGGLRPEHNAINRFRQRCLPLVKGLFRQVLASCVRMGMVSFGQISLDGSKIEANASKHSSMSADHIEKRIRSLEGLVDGVMSTADSADSVEEAAEKLAELKAEIAKYEGHRDELKRRAEAGGREVAPRDQINFTDPESRIMETRHDGFQQCYNAQAAVDRDQLVIIATDLTQACTDFGMLQPMVDQISANISELEDLRPGTDDGTERGEQASFVCADAGYSSRENLAYLDGKEGIHALIADKRLGTERKRFDKANFKYDAELNTYTCPEGKTLYPPKSSRPESERVTYACLECGECPHRSECIQQKSAKAMRTVLRHRNDHLVEQMRADVAENSSVYRNRMSTVEPAWGIIKLIMGFLAFSLRGLENASGEFDFVCSAYNMKRQWHWVHRHQHPKCGQTREERRRKAFASRAEESSQLALA